MRMNLNNGALLDSAIARARVRASERGRARVDTRGATTFARRLSVAGKEDGRARRPRGNGRCGGGDGGGRAISTRRLELVDKRLVRSAYCAYNDYIRKRETGKMGEEGEAGGRGGQANTNESPKARLPSWSGCTDPRGSTAFANLIHVCRATGT